MKEKEALTREDLDLAKCDDPDCEQDGDHPMPITPSCHPGAPVVVLYAKDEGNLVLICPVCKSFVTRIVVGAREIH